MTQGMERSCARASRASRSAAPTPCPRHSTRTAIRPILPSGRSRAIGTARLLPDGRIGRMAVLVEWRGQGVGAALLEALLALAHERSMPCVMLHAQTHAAGFYRRFGFNERGGEFLEA